MLRKKEGEKKTSPSCMHQSVMCACVRDKRDFCFLEQLVGGGARCVAAGWHLALVLQPVRMGESALFTDRTHACELLVFACLLVACLCVITLVYFYVLVPPHVPDV